MKKKGIKILIAFILFLFATIIKIENEWITNIIYILAYITKSIKLTKENWGKKNENRRCRYRLCGPVYCYFVGPA